MSSFFEDLGRFLIFSFLLLEFTIFLANNSSMGLPTPSAIFTNFCQIIILFSKFTLTRKNRIKKKIENDMDEFNLFQIWDECTLPIHQ